MEVARANDVVAVWRLDRLGRSLHDLIILARTLDDAGIGLMSLQEKIDTGSRIRKVDLPHVWGRSRNSNGNLVRERGFRPGSPPRVPGSRKAAGQKHWIRTKRKLAVQLYKSCKATHDRRDLPHDGDFEAE